MLKDARVGDNARVEARSVRFEACTILDGDDESAEIEVLPLAGGDLDALIDGCLIHLKPRKTGNTYRAIGIGAGRQVALSLVHDSVTTALPGLRLVTSPGRARFRLQATVLVGGVRCCSGGGR